MTKKLTFGVMGCASIAQRMTIPALVKSNKVELKCIASRNNAKAKKVASQFNCEFSENYTELLLRKDIEAIYIPLPTGLHHEWVLKSLRAGKHVFVEKSLSTSFLDCVEAVELAKKYKLLLMENYMFKYHAQQDIVKSIIKDRIGTINSFQANFAFPPLPADNIRYDPKLGGGSLLDVGGYVLKALDVFFPNYKPRYLSSTLKYSDRDIDIAGSANFLLESCSSSFPANLTFGFDHVYRCNIEVWGSNCYLYTNRTFTSPPGFVPEVNIEIQGKIENILLPSDNHFLKIINHFANTILSGEYSSSYKELLTQASLQQVLRDNSNVYRNE